MAQKYNGLPLYEAYLDMTDDELGMFVISLVDAPAVERDFVAFNEQKKILTYSVANEEQQRVFGLVMECDKPIYRIGNSGYEYYITYNRKTIEVMAEKYFKMGYQNNVDTQHNFNLEEGITLTQMFIKDSEKGINPTGFEDVNDGSLFAEFHIENNEVWSAIKEGTYKGFSLAGCFLTKEVEETFKEHNKSNNTLKMKVNKVKQILRKILASFGEISTDKGTIVWDGDEDIKVGDAVHTVDEEGNEVALEDGKYTTEDKMVITITDGKVEAIEEVEKQPEEEPAKEEPTPKDVEAEEEPEGTEGKTGEDAPKEDEPAEEEPKEDEIAKIKEDITKIFGLIEEIKTQLQTSEERFTKIENSPMEKPADEAFEKLTSKDSKVNKMRQRGYNF